MRDYALFLLGLAVILAAGRVFQRKCCTETLSELQLQAAERRRLTTEKELAEKELEYKCNGAVDKLFAYLKKRGFSGFESGDDHREFEEQQMSAREINAKVVCQTGMEAGVSALSFLCASSDVVVHAIDPGANPFMSDVHKYLIDQFGAHRFKLNVGDSITVLPVIKKSGGFEVGALCDLVFIGALHMQSHPLMEMKNFAPISVPGAMLLVENCNRGGVGASNKGYWQVQNKTDVIHQRYISMNCDLEDQSRCRKICVATYNPARQDLLGKR